MEFNSIPQISTIKDHEISPCRGMGRLAGLGASGVWDLRIGPRGRLPLASSDLSPQCHPKTSLRSRNQGDELAHDQPSIHDNSLQNSMKTLVNTGFTSVCHALHALQAVHGPNAQSCPDEESNKPWSPKLSTNLRHIVLVITCSGP